ncbi:MAG: hypothetical protein J5504_03565 [Butyrivibrio sp.]|nr:hypothetical protein [Butyrivibrio sp.]
MKKKQALAILIASSMALSIVGCSGSATSASEGSSEMEVTEAEQREIAKAEMVATESASSVEDAATIASSEDQVSAAASTATSDNKDAAMTATSTDKSANATPVKLADHEIICNGKVISVLNETSKTFEDLGAFDRKITDIPEQPFYIYDSFGIDFSTHPSNGKELPIGIGITNKNIVTSRNIGIGDSKDKIVAAYGTPVEQGSYYGQTGDEYYYKYQFDKFSICFYLNAKNNTVVWYEIDNTANADIMNKKSSSPATIDTTTNSSATTQPAATTDQTVTKTDEQQAPTVEKYGNCGKAYAKIAKDFQATNSNYKYALLYLTKSTTPELVIDNPGHDISMYTFENGNPILITKNLAYGKSPKGYGTTSYCYIPYANTFFENTNNCFGCISHFEIEDIIRDDVIINNMSFFPRVSEVVPSFDHPDAPRPTGEATKYTTWDWTEEDAKAKLADTHWQKIEGNMDYNTLLSEIERLGL